MAKEWIIPKVGMRVKVKSRQEIKETLDERDHHKRMESFYFNPSMWQYCGEKCEIEEIRESESIILKGVTGIKTYSWILDWIRPA